MKNPELVTIVTAFRDLGRGGWSSNTLIGKIPKWLNRTNEEYLEYFSRLCQLKNPIIVFASNGLRDKLLEIRSDLTVLDIDEIWNENFQLRERISVVHKNNEFKKFVDSPKMPEYWNSDYVYVNFLKSIFVTTAIEKCQTGNVLAWMDFGYMRPYAYLPASGEWKFDAQGRMCLFSRAEGNLGRPIFELIKSGDVLIQGSMIIGAREIWDKFSETFFEKAIELLQIGLIDDDQTVLLMTYRELCETIDLIPFSPDEWFAGLKYSIAP
jgi:protein YibB